MAPKNTPVAAADQTNAAAPAAAEKAPRVAPVLTAISTAVPMPQNLTKRSRGGNSLYPFDSLVEVGQSFGIKNKTAKNLASVISGANKRYMVDAVDAHGNPVFKQNEVKQADGSVTKVPTLEREKMPGKTFVAADVDPKTDPDGATVRVWRKS